MSRPVNSRSRLKVSKCIKFSLFKIFKIIVYKSEQGRLILETSEYEIRERDNRHFSDNVSTNRPFSNAR
jgi:hypothetical protein